MRATNTRIWKAMHSLATMECDVRGRVVVACRELQHLPGKELESLPNEVGERIRQLLEKTSSKNAVYLANGNLLYDKFENSAKGKSNKTYTKYAKEIFSIYEDHLT